jgi:molybdopterin molybdotransferase
MDGWAVTAGPAGRHLAIAGESRAGRPGGATVTAETAVRISTGAALPDGAEAVIRVEDSEEDDGRVFLFVAAESGANVRAAGEDLAPGTPVLEAGTRLGPAELAAAVAAGTGDLAVAPIPSVAVLCTGDELREPGAALALGEIHNSNLLALAAQAERAGAAVARTGRIADDRAATESELDAALGAAQVTIVSGGVSVGPHDHVKPALAALGVEEAFWRVALQPGKPTWFGTRGDRLVFGLPGNPVSAQVTFALFARPALLALQGTTDPPSGTARLAEAVRRSAERELAVRVRLATDADGVRWATTTGRQNSHLVTSMVGADALALVPAGEGALAAGTPIELVAL